MSITDPPEQYSIIMYNCESDIKLSKNRMIFSLLHSLKTLISYCKSSKISFGSERSITFIATIYPVSFEKPLKTDPKEPLPIISSNS